MPKYYSRKEIFLRMLWVVIESIFFRCSPRIFYGWRNFILRLMGSRIGKHVHIFPSARIMYPWLFEIGDRSVISWDVKVYNLGKILIGNNTVISQYSHLCGGTHDYESTNFTLLPKGLTIGSNVWIGADAFIGPGVTVHDGVVVAARSVVVRDIPSLTVVAGNPARPIKKLEIVPPMLYPD